MVKLCRYVVTLLGCLIVLSATAQTGGEWQAVVEAAKAEGRVVFYTGAVGSPYHKQIAAAFEKEFGIRVDILEARASELRERISTEQAAGRFTGDVHHNGSTTTSLMTTAGNLQPLGQIPNGKQLIAPFVPGEYHIPAIVWIYGILINTEQVKSEEQPSSWKDLLDPRWKGKILSDDMRALGGGSIFFMVMHDAFGEDFHKSLSANSPVFTRDMRNAERRVAQGEYAVYIPELLGNFSLLRNGGLPVKFIIPKEGTPYVRYDLSLLKGAPHPNAARLFINFMLEKEAQLVYANGGLKPVIGGVTEHADPELQEFLKAPVLGTSDVSRQNAMLKLAGEIYK